VVGRLVSEQPPWSIEKSRKTAPGRMRCIISCVMRMGARFPGISAVVMMTSTSLACAAKRAISAAMNAGLISLA